MGLIIWKDTNGKEHIIQGDLLASITDDRATVVTEHAIEDGSAVADHVRNQTDLLTISLKQSQTPIAAKDNERNGDPFDTVSLQSVALDVRESQFEPGGLLAVTALVGQAVGAIGSLFGATEAPPPAVYVLNTTAPKDRILEIHDQLIALRQQVRECEISMLGRVYTNQILVALQYVRQGSAQVGVFNLTFRQITTVRSGQTELPDPTDLRMKDAAAFGNKPPRTAEQTEADIAKKKKSALAVANDTAGGPF